MSQRILAGHRDSDSGDAAALEAAGPRSGPRDLSYVRVDQVILAREPSFVLGKAVEAGLTKSAVEVAVAYPPYCIMDGAGPCSHQGVCSVPPASISLGLLAAQPGAGFAAAVHLERFASPSRLALTDDSRVATTGAAGMLTLVASTAQLCDALLGGCTRIRPPVSVRVQLSGRLRPFVCYRDATLELVRSGLEDVVRRVDEATQSPVVLEFAGPSCQLLSVADRAVLCSVAPRVGAVAALFSSDEKTEAFLRDQKRSKAHRALSAETNAPFEDVVCLDLSLVEPLIEDETGKVHFVRELDGVRVSQVLLGGDSGVSLRDLMTTAALLRSKRVVPWVEFLLAPPSRQMLEVIAQTDALSHLIATGARLVEPDRRILSGQLYAPRSDGVALRTSAPEAAHRLGRAFTCSADTLAFAVANGVLGDPRGFKRPVRVSIPRGLPTDDVLITRGTDAKGAAKGKGRVDKRHAESAPRRERFAESQPPSIWHQSTELLIANGRELTNDPSVLLAHDADDIKWLIDQAHQHPQLRAVVADHIPSALVTVLSGLGILALRADEETLANLEAQRSVSVPSPKSWYDAEYVELSCGASPVKLRWLAIGAERRWTSGEVS